MMYILTIIEMILMILISIAFFTLLERKVLGYIQLRKGPNKVSIMGLFQPFSDAIKLFTKEFFFLEKSNYLIFLICPLMSMMIMMLLWMLMPLNSLINYNEYMMLLIICIMSISVYFIMFAGWSSNSSYSILGSIRSIAQTISYEVSMIFIMLSIFILIDSFNLYKLMIYQNYSWFGMWNYFLMLMMMVSLLAEMNRTPFDFAEGESELVSGFNVEYMSGSFAMIFIAEYGMIMFMMFLFMLMFLGSNMISIKFYLILMMLYYLVIWIRGTYPRFRYDNLMMLTWKIYLPVSLNMLMIMVVLKIFIFIYK